VDVLVRLALLTEEALKAMIEQAIDNKHILYTEEEALKQLHHELRLKCQLSTHKRPSHPKSHSHLAQIREAIRKSIAIRSLHPPADLAPRPSAVKFRKSRSEIKLEPIKEDVREQETAYETMQFKGRVVKVTSELAARLQVRGGLKKRRVYNRRN
jgi:hypothetical protein